MVARRGREAMIDDNAQALEATPDDNTQSQTLSSRTAGSSEEVGSECYNSKT